VVLIMNQCVYSNKVKIIFLTSINKIICFINQLIFTLIATTNAAASSYLFSVILPIFTKSMKIKSIMS